MLKRDIKEMKYNFKEAVHKKKIGESRLTKKDFKRIYPLH